MLSFNSLSLKAVASFWALWNWIHIWIWIQTFHFSAFPLFFAKNQSYHIGKGTRYLSIEICLKQEKNKIMYCLFIWESVRNQSKCVAFIGK